MPRIKLSPELKRAISNLSHQEKDKLIFRMLPSNDTLVNQLVFQLLEGEESIVSRREEVKDYLDKGLEASYNSYYSPGYVMMDLRSLSGSINRHVKATKDKIGEIELHLFMLEKALYLFSDYIQGSSQKKAYKLCVYIIKRSFKIIALLEKQHEDIQWDYIERIQQLGEILKHTKYFPEVAEELALDLQLLQNYKE